MKILKNFGPLVTGDILKIERSYGEFSLKVDDQPRIIVRYDKWPKPMNESTENHERICINKFVTSLQEFGVVDQVEVLSMLDEYGKPIA